MKKEIFFAGVDQHDGRIDARGWSSLVGNETGPKKGVKLKKKS